MDPILTFLGAPVRSLSIEITNRCYLGCSECARNLNPDLVKKPVDLSLEHFKSFYPLSDKKLLKKIKLNLCGTFGDCIYHPQFLDFIEYIRSIGSPIYIETNGSFKDENFWKEAAKILGPTNWVNFSIDGLKDTNELYRKRACWEDIETAIKTCVPKTNVRWKWIVFKTNEHQINEGIAYAKKLGVHHFMIQRSDRFKSNGDALVPRDENWKSFVLENKQLVRKILQSGSEEEIERIGIRPKCLTGKSISLSSNGLFHPCQAAYGSWSWGIDKRLIEGISIEATTLKEALVDPLWNELKEKWQNPLIAPEACLRKCGVHQEFSSNFDLNKKKSDLLGAKPFVDELIILNTPH